GARHLRGRLPGAARASAPRTRAVMRRELAEAVAAAVGSAVTRAQPVGGGCINEAFACELADGRRVFVKSSPGADPRLFPAEARGLAWLAEAGALRVPRVIAVSAEADAVAFLALEYLEPA